MKTILLRIFADVVLILLAFMAPWWLTFLASIVVAFYFSFYFEFFAIGGILYLLFYHFTGFAAVVPLILYPAFFLGIEYGKGYLIFYHYE